MTTTMQAWLEDAKDFGMSDCLQKGFLFCLGIEAAINPKGIDLEILKTAAERFSECTFPVPDDAYCDFDEGEIEKLLYEAGKKSLGDEFSPRIISGPRVNQELHFLGGPPSVLQLPDVGGGMLCEWGRFLSKLYEEMGRHVTENGETAFLAGLVYASAVYQIDKDTTRNLAVILSTGRPPHLDWFSEIIYRDNEFIKATRQHLPLQKTLHMLVGPGLEKFPCSTNAAIELLEKILFKDNGDPDEEANTYSVKDFCLRLSFTSIHFGQKIPEEEKEALITSGYEEPPLLKDKEECVNHIAGIIKKKFHYDVLADDVSSGGEEHTQKSCIMLTAVATSLLNPGWNKVVLS